jgi:transposase-like protein
MQIQIDPAAHPVCPRCGSELIRTRRRLIDRLASVFKPVQRYRCGGLGCGWVGNFKPAAFSERVEPRASANGRVTLDR